MLGLLLSLHPCENDNWEGTMDSERQDYLEQVTGLMRFPRMERILFITGPQAHHRPLGRVFWRWLRAGTDVVQPLSLGALLVDPACCHQTCSGPLAQGMWDCSLAPEATDPSSLAASHDSCPTSLEAPGTY